MLCWVAEETDGEGQINIRCWQEAAFLLNYVMERVRGLVGAP